MAKPPKKPKPEEIETEPGAWERFERMMNKIVQPKPHKPPLRETERRHKGASKINQKRGGKASNKDS